MFRRINFYGGSGTGKSTIAADVYAELKMKGYSVELVREKIKLMAYQGRFPTSFKQGKIFYDQLDDEDDHLAHVDYIVSDSPLHMNVAYSKHYGFEGWPDLLSLANRFEEKFPSINFWCHRKWPYRQEGRYQDETESMKIDDIIHDIAFENIARNRLHFMDMTILEFVACIEKEIKNGADTER